MRRFSGVDSIYRLNVSDSVSNHEEAKIEEMANEKENEHEDNAVFSDEKQSDTDIKTQVRSYIVIDSLFI